MREKFVDIRFRDKTLAVIQAANDIISAYQAQGFVLTVRQLYYQFVARDLIPNRVSEYKKLAATIDNARKAGLIDWDAIEDRTRFLRSVSTWDSPGDIIRSAYASYREDWWIDQPAYVEVWIEKDALIGVIEDVCEEYRVPYFACRGYASQSELYTAGKRMYQAARRNKRAVVLHLGDHDPSGIDMTRDLEDRLNMFAYGSGPEVRRLALNMEQIEEYEPPPNPAKDTDSRFYEYQQQFGDSSWELDALEPQVIADLIRSELGDILDFERWGESEEAENASKLALMKAHRHWPQVAEFLTTVSEENGT